MRSQAEKEGPQQVSHEFACDLVKALAERVLARPEWESGEGSVGVPANVRRCSNSFSFCMITRLAESNVDMSRWALSYMQTHLD